MDVLNTPCMLIWWVPNFLWLIYKPPACCSRTAFYSDALREATPCGAMAALAGKDSKEARDVLRRLSGHSRNVITKQKSSIYARPARQHMCAPSGHTCRICACVSERVPRMCSCRKWVSKIVRFFNESRHNVIHLLVTPGRVYNAVQWGMAGFTPYMHAARTMGPTSTCKLIGALRKSAGASGRARRSMRVRSVVSF
eukprot:5706538-Pleurochrysis_carterae.AAC.2